ncbi:hypothetical protein FE697_002110 [Mumia zhuanghuii]|uniref:Uncharacterized protein n=2 Tax=Mumia TaxID=1546255 RepID=A0ABW1QHR5_9ACTN|nr:MULTISPECIES: hypothetical protein [Mumia]KAA1424735.1 hypothetical protein FE697_002110 [Mumia zhuanghuii]
MLHDLGTRVRAPLALGATSTLVGILAVWWLAAPDDNPFRHTAGAVSLVGLLPGSASAVLLLVASALGLAVAAGLRRGSAPRGLLVPAALVAAALTAFCMDTQLISFVGYLCAMTIPLVGVILVVSALGRSTAARVTALVAVGLVIWWGVASGSLAPDAIAELVRNLGSGYARVGARPWLLLGLALATAQWLSLTATLASPLTDRLARPSARLDRITTVATVVAALGPLPYVAVRATWLLPDGLFTGPITPADLDPSTRLWGLLLGAAALGGSILTVGLIRPWGRVFPTWMPHLGGRPVPVAAAAVPGYAVAFVLTASAPSIVLLSFEQAADGDPDALWMLLLLPFWMWGPALAVAVWGYVRRRRLEALPAPRPTPTPGRMAA